MPGEYLNELYRRKSALGSREPMLADPAKFLLDQELRGEKLDGVLINQRNGHGLLLYYVRHFGATTTRHNHIPCDARGKLSHKSLALSIQILPAGREQRADEALAPSCQVND